MSDPEGSVDPPTGGWTGRTWVALAVVLGVGVAAFGITAAVRSGDGDAVDEAVETTEPPAATTTAPPTSDGDGAPDPIVAQVEMAVVEPIASGDDETALDPPDLSDVVFPDDVDLDQPVLSPIIGVATGGVVEVDGTSYTEPAPYAEVFGPSDVGPADLIAEDPPGDAPLASPTVEVGDDVDVDEVLAVLERTAEPAPPTPSEPAAGESEEPAELAEISTTPDGEPTLADPCADSEEPDRCPDPGEPGTIVGTFALTAPPPLRVRVMIPGPVECPVTDEDDEISIGVESTTPLADFRLNYWRAGWPSEDLNVEFSTPDDEVAAWLSAFDASTTDPPPPVLHCATLTDLFLGRQHQYRAWATDVFDREWQHSGTPPIFDGPDFPLPRTFVLTLSDNEVLVSAPHREDQRVAILAYRRNDDRLDGPVDPCTTTSPTREQPGFDRARSPIEINTSRVSSADLFAGGFDQRYTRRSIGTMRLDEGSRYVLCVHWSVQEPSFALGIERTEAYELATPDSFQYTFSVFDVETFDDARLRAETLEVEIAPAGRGIIVGHPWCGRWTNPTDIRGRELQGDVICQAPARATSLYERGARVTMTIDDLDGEERTISHLLPIPTCDAPCAVPPSDWYRLDLPTGRPQRDFWCGGLGDACDRPSDETFGTITLQVNYANPGGTQQRGWGIAPPRVGGDLRPTPPETPQLDTQQTPRTSGGLLRSQTLEVPVIADRPVTVSVDLRAPDGSPGCAAGDQPRVVTSDTLDEEHTIVFEGLCPLTSYFPIVELTAADGSTSRWHGAMSASGFPAAETWLRGYILTRPIRFEYAANLRIEAPSEGIRIGRLVASFGGNNPAWPGATTTTVLGCRPLLGGPITSTARRAMTIPNERIIGSSGLEVPVEFVLNAELTTSSCRRLGIDQPEPLEFRATVPYEQFRSGEPVTIRATKAVPDLGPDAEIVIELEATFLGETG